MSESGGQDGVEIDYQEYPSFTTRKFNTVSRLSLNGGLLSSTAEFDRRTVQSTVGKVRESLRQWADEFGYDITESTEKQSAALPTDATEDFVLLTGGDGKVRVLMGVRGGGLSPEEFRATIDFASHDPDDADEYATLRKYVTEACEWDEVEED